MSEETTQPVDNSIPEKMVAAKKIRSVRHDDAAFVKVLQQIAEDLDVDTIMKDTGISKSALPIIKRVAAIIVENPEAMVAAKAISEMIAKAKSDAEFIKRINNKDTKEPYADWK